MPLRLQPVPGSVHIFADASQCYALTALPIPVISTPCIASTANCASLPQLRFALLFRYFSPRRIALLCRYLTVAIHFAATPKPFSVLLCHCITMRYNSITCPDRALHLRAIAKQSHSVHSHCISYLCHALPLPCMSLQYRYSSPSVSSLSCPN